MAERVLFFAPHAGIWQHAFPEALVVDAVRQAGAEVVYVTCGGQLSPCMSMAAVGVLEDSSAAEKAAACAACRRNRDVLRDTFGFRGYHFAEALTPADEARIASLLGGIDPARVSDLVLNGIKVGQLTLYEYLLQTKRLTVGNTEWHTFRPRLENALRSCIAAQRILEREKPTRVVAYNTLYSVNAVWRAVAERAGIPMFTLHAGPSLANRLSTLMIGRGSTTDLAYHHVAAWPEHAAIPATPYELSLVTDHFVEVLRGRNVLSYSAPKAAYADIRARLGIRDDQRMLVATMSSYDEYVAACVVGEMPSEATLLFSTQISWIKALVEWVRDRPDLFLVIRVHPRELPNKREGVTSEHAQMLQRELISLPPNARVNWPTDKISLWDLAEHASVILNAWSSAGKEMALLGLPVVAYCPTLLMYAPELNFVGETHDSYFAAIETALGTGWSFERIRMAYRWCAVEYVRSIADVSDGFAFAETHSTNIFARMRNLVLAQPYVRQTVDVLRRPRQLREQDRIARTILLGATSLLDVTFSSVGASTQTETRALHRELGRLVAALYPGERSPPTPGTLRANLMANARAEPRGNGGLR